MGFFSKAQLAVRLLVGALSLIVALQGTTIWLLLERPAACAPSIDAPAPLP